MWTQVADIEPRGQKKKSIYLIFPLSRLDRQHELALSCDCFSRLSANKYNSLTLFIVKKKENEQNTLLFPCLVQSDRTNLLFKFLGMCPPRQMLLFLRQSQPHPRQNFAMPSVGSAISSLIRARRTGVYLF